MDWRGMRNLVRWEEFYDELNNLINVDYITEETVKKLSNDERLINCLSDKFKKKIPYYDYITNTFNQFPGRLTDYIKRRAILLLLYQLSVERQVVSCYHANSKLGIETLSLSKIVGSKQENSSVRLKLLCLSGRHTGDLIDIKDELINVSIKFSQYGLRDIEFSDSIGFFLPIYIRKSNNVCCGTIPYGRGRDSDYFRRSIIQLNKRIRQEK